MPSGRSNIFSTPEFSSQVREEHVCYDRKAGRDLLLKKLLTLVPLRR